MAISRLSAICIGKLVDGDPIFSTEAISSHFGHFCDGSGVANGVLCPACISEDEEQFTYSWSCCGAKDYEAVCTSTHVHKFLDQTLFANGLRSLGSPTREAVVTGEIRENFSNCFEHVPDTPELQFLSDLIECRPGTAGARFANWVEDAVFVCPENCFRVGGDASNSVVLGDTFSFTLQTSDSKKQLIDCPEGTIVAHVRSRLDDPLDPYDKGQGKAAALLPMNSRTGQSFVCSPALLHDDVSPEEERYKFKYLPRPGPPKIIRTEPGNFKISWTPSREGTFLVEVKIDGKDVRDAPFEILVKPNVQNTGALGKSRDDDQSKLVLIDNVDYNNFDVNMSAGQSIYVCTVDIHRVFGGTSTETIEMGTVLRDKEIHVTGDVEENDEGTWLKLAQESVDEYVEADMRFMDAWVQLSTPPSAGGIVFLKFVRDKLEPDQEKPGVSTIYYNVFSFTSLQSSHLYKPLITRSG